MENGTQDREIDLWKLVWDDTVTLLTAPKRMTKATFVRKATMKKMNVRRDQKTIHKAIYTAMELGRSHPYHQPDFVGFP